MQRSGAVTSFLQVSETQEQLVLHLRGAEPQYPHAAPFSTAPGLHAFGLEHAEPPSTGPSSRPTLVAPSARGRRRPESTEPSAVSSATGEASPAAHAIMKANGTRTGNTIAVARRKLRIVLTRLLPY
jgi:hypothetical protein